MYRTFFLILTTTCQLAKAADWTTWRSDHERSGYTEDTLPDDLKLRWTWIPKHAPAPAWPRDDRMSFDRVSHVVIAGGLVCFGNSVDGTVTALDWFTGELKWKFQTGGPVRFAPTVWRDQLYVTSDDGFLYALKLRSGEMTERWRGGPDEDRVLGNSQIISKWPARGGPVIADGVLYWGAGIWQSEGVFLHALNLETGKRLWVNDSSGGIEMPQPHGGANAKSGVSAQGYLLANDDRLFVPTGRAVPAAFQRSSGKFEYYRLQENTRRGDTAAVLRGELLYNGGYVYQTKDGAALADRVPGAVAAYPGGVIHATASQMTALTVGTKTSVDRRGEEILLPAHKVRWKTSGNPGGSSLIIAGNTIVSAGGQRVATVNAETGAKIWSGEVDDVAYGLAVSEGRLYVSTASGAIHCFVDASVPQDKAAIRHDEIIEAAYPNNETIQQTAKAILQSSGITAGYCVDLGCGDGRLAYELAKQSDLYVVGIESDAKNVAAARRKLEAAGLYGSRVTIHQADPSNSHLPKYFANLIVSQKSATVDASSISEEEVLRLQRPFGGVTCFGPADGLTVNSRGDLDGAGEWTHLYSNPANTLCSTDTIKGPLTAVWYRDIDLNLPQRHGRGPSPLFYKGRLFAEGLDELIAVDAYNGRLLWRFKQQGILDAYDADHLAGSAVTGSNMCISDDSVFLCNGSKCFRIDAATGIVKAMYEAPPHPDNTPATWGYIACQNGVLFGSTANESHIVRHAYIRADDHMKKQFSESTSLFALDIKSGRRLWQYTAKKSIRHNAIAIGPEYVYLIDRDLAVDDLLSNAPARRGEKPANPPAGHATGELVTLDTQTGEQKWRNNEDIFGTALSFSDAYDVLLMFYQPTSFRLPSEVGGRIAAFQGGGGYRLWEKKVAYRTRPLINQDSIVAHPSALNLLTGEEKSMTVPKSYGCGQISGARNLLMFRSGTLGYYDFTRNAGTENYGGIRPGCWINALPVGGLVLVPDASAGCSCSYQNRSWVALEGSD